MKHYAIEKWVDYLRGLVQEPERSAMKAHLEGACPACGRITARLRAVSVHNPEIAVPDDVVRRAKAIFPVKSTWPENPIRTVLAQLMFDSRAVAAMGVRSAAGEDAWSVTFGSGNMTIEVLVDEQGRRRRTVVTGQVTPPAPHEGGAYLIRLTAKGKRLEETRTTAVGEFQFDFQWVEGIRLFVAAGREIVEVPLGDIMGSRKIAPKKRHAP